jgi:hypothetical protein
MNDTKPWGQKLDPYSRLQLENGLPAVGVDVTVRLTGKDTAAARQVERAGLKLHAQVGDILVGHVTNSTDLRHIAKLACVQEVQLARPLYEDGLDLTGKER